jgi:hypothetical protein
MDTTAPSRRPFPGPAISRLAAEMAPLVGAGDERSLAEARRLAFSFIETFHRAAPEHRRLLVGERPPHTGDPRFDALLAAVVEHVCAEQLIPAPGWVAEPDRFLDRWWFMSGLSSLHADALVHSPISFARRGIFVTGDALTYA